MNTTHRTTLHREQGLQPTAPEAVDGLDFDGLDFDGDLPGARDLERQLAEARRQFDAMLAARRAGGAS